MQTLNASVVKAIRDCLADSDFSGAIKCGHHTVVFQQHYGVRSTPGYGRTIELIYDGVVLALIEPSLRRLSLYHGDRIATRRRINYVLAEFSPDWTIGCKNDVVMYDKHYNPRSFYEGFTVEFDPWHNLRFSRWAADKAALAATGS